MADQATGASPLLTEGLVALPPEQGFGELLPCRMCGGRPYAYDMRSSGTHECCMVECGSCDHDAEGDTPEAAAAKWHAARA